MELGRQTSTLQTRRLAGATQLSRIGATRVQILLRLSGRRSCDQVVRSLHSIFRRAVLTIRRQATQITAFP